MRSKSQERCLFLAAVATLLLTANICWAQTDSTPKKRLRSPATVRGFVGGESQDHYVIRARKGQTMTVRISWRREDDNQASFDVSPASDSGEAGQVISGIESDNGKRWTGKIPKTGDYVISVVAHPSAQYTLRVRVR
jgi:hypothetical protein